MQRLIKTACAIAAEEIGEEKAGRIAEAAQKRYEEHTVIVVSNYDKDNDVYVGLPAVLNKNGVDRKIYFNLNNEEEQKLQNSIDILKEAINSVDL